MNNFHIHPETGDAGKCDAKKRSCPYKGENNDNHFESKEAAEKFYELEQSMIYNPKSIKVRQNDFNDNALTNNLNYTGKIPRWFKKHPTLLQEDLFGTKPEIIDVIDSPIGKLAVVYEENSDSASDIYTAIRTGSRISKISYRNFKTGETVAKLISALHDEKSTTISYGDDDWRGFRYLRTMRGFYSMEDEEDRAPIHKKLNYAEKLKHPYIVNPPNFEKDEDIKDFIQKARSKLNLDYFPTDNLSREELLSEVNELKLVANQSLQEYSDMTSYPIIDSSKITSDNLRGIGLGSSMYIYLGRKLAETNNRLDASSLQTDEAKKVWIRLAADERIPVSVKRVVYDGKIHAKYSIDFTIK